MSTIEKHRAFLDSLEGERGLPDEWRLLTPFVDVWKTGDEFFRFEYDDKPEWITIQPHNIGQQITIVNPCRRRAESRQIPDLKEKVKAFGLVCMDAERNPITQNDGTFDRQLFRALCAPEVKP